MSWQQLLFTTISHSSQQRESDTTGLFSAACRAYPSWEGTQNLPIASDMHFKLEEATNEILKGTQTAKRSEPHQLLVGTLVS